MRSAAVFFSAIVLLGCGPSPAAPAATPVRVVRVPADRVVEACPCNDDDDEDDDELAVVRPTPVEYVRIDEWEPPPSVKEIESRIEPRGDKPPDYIRFPRLTLHKDIAPATVSRRGTYWH